MHLIDRNIGAIGKSIILKRAVEDGGLVDSILLFPAAYRPLLQRQRFVDGGRLFDGVNPPQPLAGGTGSFLRIEGEEGAGNFVHPPAALAAVHIDVEILSDLFCRLLTVGG